jgi:hypothetical protein
MLIAILLAGNLLRTPITTARAASPVEYKVLTLPVADDTTIQKALIEPGRGGWTLVLCQPIVGITCVFRR